MTRPLESKVALITGASAGVGAATARSLLDGGARIIVTARRIDRLRALAAELDGAEDRILAIEADLLNDDSIAALMQAALEWSGGSLDILINNAGLSHPSTVEQAALADLRVMLDTNVLALANITRLAIPALKSTKGYIVNIASGAAKTMVPGAALYSATKAAVACFSEALRKELIGDGVRVTTIFPGIIATEFFDQVKEPEKRKGFDAMLASIDPLTAEDIAELILFAVTRPDRLTMSEIVIRPTKQA